MNRDPVASRFRRAAARFATGVTVVSTTNGGTPHAMTVNSFATVSLDPLLVLVSLSLSCRTYERIRTSGVFAVTVLAAHQRRLADWFANPRRSVGAEAFAGMDWQPAPISRAPVLAGGVSYFDCAIAQVMVAGDHAVVLGAVQAFELLSDEPPLVFLDSAYAAPLPADLQVHSSSAAE